MHLFVVLSCMFTMPWLNMRVCVCACVRGDCVRVCVCAWWLCACVRACVVHVINSIAVPCFSPWAAAGTSWSSAQVWSAGRWAAVCGPAAAATPDSGETDTITQHQSTWQPQHNTQEPMTNTITLKHHSTRVILFVWWLVLCLLSIKRNWLHFV